MATIFQQQYTKNGVTKKCRIWSMKYRDHEGHLRVESTKCRDRTMALGVLTRAVRRVELIRAGVLSPEQAGALLHASRPLQEHVDAWLANLRAHQRSTKYQQSCRWAMARLQREIKWPRLVDLTYESFDKWIRGADLGARSRNAYRETLVAFCSWCVDTGRLTSNPFLSYPVASVEANPSRPRGAFTADELRSLIAVTERRSPARALAYRVMSLTGLRCGELRALRVADFDGKSLHLAAQHAKNGKAATIRLRQDLAAAIATWVHGKGVDEPLIPLPEAMVRRLNGDLKAAGIAKVVAGKSRDVHSFRHTFATMLAASGVHPRVAQKLMRHSTINLTMKFYTDADHLDDTAAVEGLPSFSPESNDRPSGRRIRSSVAFRCTSRQH